MQILAESSRAFCASYVSAPAAKRFVLGTGEYARSIADALEISAFVDDFTSDSVVSGTPVIRASELPSDALIVVASMLRPKSALRALKDLDVRALDYFAFAAYSDLPVKPVAFWPAFASDFRANRDKYEVVRDKLSDKISQKVFDDLVRFRLHGDLSAMADYEFDPQGQYFEDFLELQPLGESFIDVGSYDGQTSLEFARRVQEFESILAFEPSHVSFPVVQSALSGLSSERTQVLPFALGSAASTQRFSAEDGSASRVSKDGQAVVTVVTLDSLDLNAGSFMKMDIEGGEVEALRGARETIRRLQPRLAISVYHKFDDLWRVPEVVDQAGVKYRLFLRHYTEGIDETVMFFIPPAIDCDWD